jgi:hypothetical protein
MLDIATRETVEKTLRHEVSEGREFYSTLPRPVCVGIEATGSMQWFVNLMEELGIEFQVGHPAEIRATEPRKQKNDRRDGDLILKLLVENREEQACERPGARLLMTHQGVGPVVRKRVNRALAPFLPNRGPCPS